MHGDLLVMCCCCDEVSRLLGQLHNPPQPHRREERIVGLLLLRGWELCVVFGANRDALAEMWEVVGGVFVEEVEPAN